MDKICIACGMPMKTKDDFAMGDENKNYCKYCAHPDGSMHNYEEKLKGMTEFIMKTQGFAEKPAREAAAAMMSKLPAWSK